MKVIYADNVREALALGTRYLRYEGLTEDSRNGPVLVAEEPVTTRYRRPMDRVLLCPKRDANPFFHLMESMWMLAGRNDATYLDTYVRDFSSRFAEADGLQWGAYGHRWRFQWEEDQLETVIDRLRKVPNDRRAVLTMWDPNYDLLPPASPAPRDIPCNTHVYFRRREDLGLLDMMVCCRSNDIIWGAYGANAVHFAFLLEYVAAMVGLPPGAYHQVSFNYHAYRSVLDRVGTPEAVAAPGWNRLVDHPSSFDQELHRVLAGSTGQFNNSFLSGTVAQAMTAHSLFKAEDKEGAHRCAMLIKAPDWRMACAQWIERRRSPTPT